MFLLNGRGITPFKRLFSFKCSSDKISKQNYHKSQVNLNKYDRERDHDEFKKTDNKRNVQALKKFSFIQLEPDSTPQKEPTTHKVPGYTKTLDKLKVQIKKETKEVIQKNASVVETLANLINKLEPDKTAKKLFEPFENLPSKQKKLEKQGNNKTNNKQTKLARNQKAKPDEAALNTKQPKTDKQNKSDFQNLLRNVVEEVKKEESKQHQSQGLKLFQSKKYLLTRQRTSDGSNLSKDTFMNVHNLNSGIGLNLFENVELTPGKAKITLESPVWEMHYIEELSMAQEVPPINGFDEMVMLTNEGKIWNFPIDNEQGVDEDETKIPFEDHVFLDNYLEQFPDISAVQEFMTLVLNGLSKNSHLTLEEKRAIISWYQDYFNEKRPLIEEALNAERLEQEYHAKLEAQKSQMASKQPRRIEKD